MKNRTLSKQEHFLFYCDKLSAKTVVLDSIESNHITSVLRLQPGDPLSLTDGKGCLATAVITEVKKTGLTATVTSRKNVPQPKTSVTLIVGIPERDAFKTVLSDATALGVARIIPAVCEYCQKPWWASNWEKHRDRFQLKLITALKQSKNCYLPKLESPAPLDSVLGTLTGQKIVADSSGTPLIPVIKDRDLSQPVTIAIGPPGGFTEKELERMQEQSFTAVSIAAARLRTELAASVAVGQLIGCAL